MRGYPTKEDIGRGVLYTPRPGVPPERGIITDVRANSLGLLVMVRYGSDVHSKATFPEDLEWEFQDG